MNDPGLKPGVSPRKARESRSIYCSSLAAFTKIDLHESADFLTYSKATLLELKHEVSLK